LEEETKIKQKEMEIDNTWRTQFQYDHQFKFDKQGFKQLILMGGNFWTEGFKLRQTVTSDKWKTFWNRHNMKDKWIVLTKETILKVYGRRWNYEYDIIEQINVLKFNRKYIDECAKLKRWYPKFTNQYLELCFHDYQESAPWDLISPIYHPRVLQRNPKLLQEESLRIAKLSQENLIWQLAWT
jgi:hypothetical protein